MSDFLKTSELTETRAFVHSFVKEVQVKPGKAAIIYSIPKPERPGTWGERTSLRSPSTAEFAVQYVMVGLRVLYCELFGTQSQYEWVAATRV